MTQAVSSFDSDRHPAVWKGAVAGGLSGLAGAWVMNQFQAAVSRAPASRESDRADSSENATVKAAEAIVEPALDRPLTRDEKKLFGPLIHYSIGSSLGAIYGMVAELLPQASMAWGIPFGAAVWLGADEVAVPVLGLSKSPTEYPVSTHASALAAHIVYGVTTDLVRRVIRVAT